MLPLLDLALVLAQERLRERAGYRDPEQGPPAKPWVHARLHGLALHQDVLAREVCPPAGGVGAPHIDRLVTLAGTVTKAGPVKALEARRVYECGRCHHRRVLGWGMGSTLWGAGVGRCGGLGCFIVPCSSGTQPTRCQIVAGSDPARALPFLPTLAAGLWCRRTLSWVARWRYHPCALQRAPSPAAAPRSGGHPGWGCWSPAASDVDVPAPLPACLCT